MYCSIIYNIYLWNTITRETVVVAIVHSSGYSIVKFSLIDFIRLMKLNLAVAS